MHRKLATCHHKNGRMRRASQRSSLGNQLALQVLFCAQRDNTFHPAGTVGAASVFVEKTLQASGFV
jgi:hypothetical protein